MPCPWTQGAHCASFDKDEAGLPRGSKEQTDLAWHTNPGPCVSFSLTPAFLAPLRGQRHELEC